MQLLAEAARNLTQADHDLELVLRKCQLACQILNWIPARDWFQHELAGYPPDIAAPPHRRLGGRRVPSACGSWNRDRRVLPPPPLSMIGRLLRCQPSCLSDEG